jgi:hypothetical protein
MSRLVAMLALTLALASCNGNSGQESTSGDEKPVIDDRGRCPKPEADPRKLEVSDYDTNGDDRPDVRKVFLVFDVGRDRRTVLICREADLNGDGIKDLVRFYDDEGNVVREEGDRNFDGRVDVTTHFDAGEVVSKELDDNFDGRVEAKVFFEGGRIVRVERDLTGRDPKVFRTDRWEYIEEGRIVRIGTDLDGDGKVDRWDRDLELERDRRAEELRQRREVGADDDGE